MQKVAVQLSEKEAGQLLEQLANQVSPATKIRLVRHWGQRGTRLARFRALMARIDQRLQQHPEWRQQALDVIAPARREFYARRRTRHQRAA